MYKYSCYTENTKEAREWLEGIGYNINSIFDSRFIKTTTYGKAIDYHFKSWIYSEEVIDCTNNLPLFKALTAVRDDSDIKQWFTDGKVWCLCEENSIKEHLIYTKGDFTDLLDSKFHKATDKELIEKFKKKEE